MKINNQLQQTEAAECILQYTQMHMHKPQINIKPTWFEKLNRWEEALDASSEMHLECPPNDLNANITASLGTMRCLKALGEWDRLNNSNRLDNKIEQREEHKLEPKVEIYKGGSKRRYKDSVSLKHERENSQRQRGGFNLRIAKINKQKKNTSRRIKSAELKKDTETILLQFERDVAPLGAMAC